MSEQVENAAGDDGRNLPVLAEAVEVTPVEPGASPAPMLLGVPAPIAAATGGFLAGLATLALTRVLRRGTRRLALPGRRRRRRRGRAIEVAATRSFLVDVHLLKR